MSVFRNRHVVIAALIAPVLALIAYFSVDYLFGERPQAARAGASYPLVETPGCRYAGGNCRLKNEDFVLSIAVMQTANGAGVLTLESNVALEGVRLAVHRGEGVDEAAPREMLAVNAEGNRWTLDVPPLDPSRDRLRLAASARGSIYFGEASTSFLGREE